MTAHRFADELLSSRWETVTVYRCRDCDLITENRRSLAGNIAGNRAHAPDPARGTPTCPAGHQ